MRKGTIVAIATFAVTLLFALSLFGSLRASAQQNTPGPTDTVDCNPQASLDSLTFISGQANGDTAHDLDLLKQAQDAINAELAACNNVPTSTPTVTETKVGTLTLGEARTATRAAVNDQRTATASVKTATASFISQYKTIARGELSSYADKHIGEKIKIQGRVFHIIDDQDLQIFLSDGVTAVYVLSLTPFAGIYENDYVTVYGTVDGFFSGTNSFGGTVTQPQVTADLIVKGG